MARRKWSVPFRRSALKPIPRVVDNTEEMAIRQHIIDEQHRPLRPQNQPGGPGTFSPRDNTNFK